MSFESSNIPSLAEAALSERAEWVDPWSEKTHQVGAQAWLQTAFDRLDKASVDPLTRAQVSNAVARRIMGWSVHSEDRRRIWRLADGSAVRWNGHDGKSYTICAQPWIDGLTSSPT
jgi:hypothetical protein